MNHLTGEITDALVERLAMIDSGYDKKMLQSRGVNKNYWLDRARKMLIAITTPEAPPVTLCKHCKKVIEPLTDAQSTLHYRHKESGIMACYTAEPG